MSQVTTLTDFNFDTVLAQSDLPVLVDYFAPWCAPCRVLGPVVEEIGRGIRAASA